MRLHQRDITKHLQKVYDRVKWKVLLHILVCLRFFPYFVSLIENCLSYVYFKLLLNGRVINNFKPKMGLRQGNPLSPSCSLFSELLSRILIKASKENLIHSITFGRSRPTIDHMLFADDILIFCRANKAEARALSDCTSQ